MRNFENSQSLNDFFIRNLKNLEKRNIVSHSHRLFSDMALDVLNDINKIQVNRNSSTCNVQNFDAMQKERITELNRSFNEIASDTLLSYYNKPNLLSKDLYFLNTSFDALGMKPIRDVSTFADSVYHVDPVDHTDDAEKTASDILELAKNGLPTHHCEEQVKNRAAEDGEGKSNVEDVGDKGIQTGRKEDTTNREDAPPHDKHDRSTSIGLEHKRPRDNSSVNETDPTICEDNNPPVLNDVGSVDENKGDVCLKFEDNKPIFDGNKLVTNEIATLNNFEAVTKLNSPLNSQLCILLQEQNSPNSHNTQISPDTPGRSKKKNKRKKRTNTSESLRKYDIMCSSFNLSITNYKKKRDRAKHLKDISKGKSGSSHKHCNFSSYSSNHVMNKTDRRVNGGRNSKRINKKNDNFKGKKKTTKEKK
ncbi:hypothetical protein C922_01094 [Plasmodium inui San Antonio 1]|uniref:Uncharacterized protein n=1 Tax=Plasmodium inui San Antonio 1 TaxID=1237626 RepID=W7AI60_9APIC|nr:hypothetical protein C922_01094 [Plasmodium inui San Antonio 1]EUD68694.1 hypothetical protein C922_01094 [Plasmodium inui San Antonio 1]